MKRGQPEYAVRIQGSNPFVSSSLERATRAAQKEADRTRKSVWIECSTGDGYHPLEAIEPTSAEL